MAYQEKQLGQSRDNDTSAHSVYSPASGVTGIVTTIVLANTSNLSARVWVYLDDDGTTYDESTTIIPNILVGAYQVEVVMVFLPMNNSAGNLAYKQGTANAITITVHGTEIS